MSIVTRIDVDLFSVAITRQIQLARDSPKVSEFDLNLVRTQPTDQTKRTRKKNVMCPFAGDPEYRILPGKSFKLAIIGRRKQSKYIAVCSLDLSRASAEMHLSVVLSMETVLIDALADGLVDAVADALADGLVGVNDAQESERHSFAI